MHGLNWLNLPNSITLARVAFVPVVALVMLDARRGGSPVLAAALVVAAALSDVLDGWLARRRDSITTFGEVVDPIADKALIASALVILVVQERTAVWVAAAIIARELAVSLMRLVAGRRGVVIPASWLGKRKATLQIVAIVVLVLAPDPGAVWAQAIVVAAVALTAISGLQYFAGLTRRLGEPSGGSGGEAGPKPAPSQAR